MTIPPRVEIEKILPAVSPVFVFETLNPISKGETVPSNNNGMKRRKKLLIVTPVIIPAPSNALMNNGNKKEDKRIHVLDEKIIIKNPFCEFNFHERK